jgi:hypothetical protein
MEVITMGSSAQDLKAIRKTGKNGKRGSVNNANRLAGLQPEGPRTGAADWGSARPEWIAAVVAAATLRGLIVSFKLSRDGGAHGLELYDNGESVRLWFNGDADLDIELEKVFAFLETIQ